MARVFDSSFERRDNETRSRHGIPWSSGELVDLVQLYREGKSLEEMCEELQRPATGTLIKLVGTGCLRQETSHTTYKKTYYYRMPLNTDAAAVNEAMNQTTTETTEKETTMTKLIDTKVFINGTDATNLSDKEIFVLIAKTEAEIDKMKAIKTPSSKLAAAIEKMQEDVVKLAAYVDER